jgi:hypothetical protein
MQKPGWRNAMKQAFSAAPATLGKTAIKAARKRRG